MPRVPRINIENALYYITCRGDNDQDIFKEAGDYTFYTDLLKRAKKQFKFKLFAFCLMPKHLHMLIELSGDSNISQIMHNLNSNYTKYFNPKYSRSGHLFQERYKMVLLEKAPYLLIASAYIHLNPRSLKLTGDIADYPYSSFPVYLNDGNGTIEMKGEAKEAKGLLKAGSYQEFVKGLGREEIEYFSKEINKGAPLGSNEFTEKIKTAIENQKTQYKDAASAGKPNKNFIIIGSSLILLLGIFNIYFYSRSLIVRDKLKKEIENRSVEISKRLGEERTNIVKDLDEKYRADMVSYEAMSKRFEIEKKKSEELEKKLKQDNAAKAK